jgi:hypothetical protein
MHTVFPSKTHNKPNIFLLLFLLFLSRASATYKRLSSNFWSILCIPRVSLISWSSVYSPGWSSYSSANQSAYAVGAPQKFATFKLEKELHAQSVHLHHSERKTFLIVEVFACLFNGNRFESNGNILWENIFLFKRAICRRNLFLCICF